MGSAAQAAVAALPAWRRTSAWDRIQYLFKLKFLLEANLDQIGCTVTKECGKTLEEVQGGAKNPVVILPDADMEMAVRIIADSAFGCADQRCPATSLAVTAGEARNQFAEMICNEATNRKVGYGLDEGVQMGPVINSASKALSNSRSVWEPSRRRVSRLMDA